MMSENRGTVLAVDDDPGALSALADALGTLGFEVVQASDGASALGAAATIAPRLPAVAVGAFGKAEDQNRLPTHRRLDQNLARVFLDDLTGQ